MMGMLLGQGLMILGDKAPLLVRPLPVWDVWWLLLLPLCIAIAIVHKCVKCRDMRDVPREAASITFWIIAGMVLAAAALQILVNFLID